MKKSKRLQKIMNRENKMKHWKANLRSSIQKNNLTTSIYFTTAKFKRYN